MRAVPPPPKATASRGLTARGAATRARIVEAAANLMYRRGVNATTLDDVRASSNTSKSQLYLYFPDKAALVHAVLDARAKQVLERERGSLERLRSFHGLERWRDSLVHNNALMGGAYGCALGSMASELSDQDEAARVALAGHFAAWEKLIADGLRRMRDAGDLHPDADPDRLATGLMAALQGGYLLAEAAHDVTPMKVALDMALEHVRSFLTSTTERPR